jgi:CRISPR type III-A-associated RAMP protein Csm5
LTSVNLRDLVEAAGQEFGYRLSCFSNGKKIPEKFREHLKDAFNNPYLPGSALKGAIRTALISEWLRSSPENEYNQFISEQGTWKGKNWAAKNLMAALIGKDANQDIFRILKVQDVLFTPNDLRLADVRWSNEKDWRSMSKRRSFKDWQEADGIFAETLQPASLSLLNLHWDGFLLSNNQWQEHGTKSTILPNDFKGLKEKLNQHALYRLDREIKFYKAQGKNAAENECHTIKSMITNQPEAAYLQISWGIGWRGMTGDWASEEQVQTFRTRFNLGKPDRPFFPKTRRLVVAGEPKYPMGWIRLWPYAHIADLFETQLAKADALAKQSDWVSQTIAKIVQQNRCSEKDALRGKALAEAWQALQAGDEKEAAFEDIKSRWLAEDWWNQPNGRSAKQAKAIYEQS